MSEALIPTIVLRRPVTRVPTAPPNGPVVVYVSIHDVEHLRMQRVWLHRARRVHPDNGGMRHEFRRVIAHRSEWQKSEEQWYSMVGMSLPRVH